MEIILGGVGSERDSERVGRGVWKGVSSSDMIPAAFIIIIVAWNCNLERKNPIES